MNRDFLRLQKERNTKDRNRSLLISLNEIRRMIKQFEFGRMNSYKKEEQYFPAEFEKLLF